MRPLEVVENDQLEEAYGLEFEAGSGSRPRRLVDELRRFYDRDPRLLRNCLKVPHQRLQPLCPSDLARIMPLVARVQYF